MKAKLYKEFCFEASHVLPNHPGKCSNLHGHSWVLKVYIEDEISKHTGMVMDYNEIKERMDSIVNDLDHAHLGAWHTPKVMIVSSMEENGTKKVSWLGDAQENPTSENILTAIGVELYKRQFRFSKLELNETCTTGCLVTWQDICSHISSKNRSEEVGYRG